MRMMELDYKLRELVSRLAGFVSPLGMPGTVISDEYIVTLKSLVNELEILINQGERNDADNI